MKGGRRRAPSWLTQPYPLRPLLKVPWRLFYEPPPTHAHTHTLAMSQLGSEKKQQTESKSHCPDRVLTTHSITHPRRFYLERKTPGRRARGRRSRGLRVWDLRIAPSAERAAKAGCGGAGRGRGRPGPVPTARSRWKDRASLGPAPRSCTDSASPRSPLLQRSKPPFTPCPGLVRLSASAGRRVLRLSRHPDLTSPSSIPPSVSRRGGHLSRSLGPPACPGCPSLSLSQPLLCPPQACAPGSLSRAVSRPLPVPVSPPHPTRLPPCLCVCRGRSPSLSPRPWSSSPRLSASQSPRVLSSSGAERPGKPPSPAK